MSYQKNDNGNAELLADVLRDGHPEIRFYNGKWRRLDVRTDTWRIDKGNVSVREVARQTLSDAVDTEDVNIYSNKDVQRWAKRSQSLTGINAAITLASGIVDAMSGG